MSPFILSFFNSIVFAIYAYLIGHIFLQKRTTDIKKIILAFGSLLIIYYCVLCLLDSIYAIFFSGLCAFFFIKIIFQENIYMSLFISVIINGLKTIFKIIVLALIGNENLLLLNTYKTLDLEAFCSNVIAMIFVLIFVFLLRKQLKILIKYISKLKNREIILLITIYIIFIIIIAFQAPINFISLQTITDFLMIFTVTALVIFNISSEKKMESLTNYYHEIFEYSRSNGELLTYYKMQVHENKNRYLMIRGMLDEPKKNVKKYIDAILEELTEKNNNYWLTELKYIPLAGIRNFINYKLIKLKELGADIEVFVSSELENIDATSLNDKEYNQMATILGVIMDNMIESITETEEKLISISIYLEDNKIHGEFVNNFLGKIDLSRLTEIGYSTKGEQHGVGLPLVDKIVKMNDRFECNPKIIDDFFIQHMVIKIHGENNLQKFIKSDS